MDLARAASRARARVATPRNHNLHGRRRGCSTHVPALWIAPGLSLTNDTGGVTGALMDGTKQMLGRHADLRKVFACDLRHGVSATSLASVASAPRAFSA